MNTCIYDKSDKGREEIATRKHHLPARLRMLLVLIDGRHTRESLLAKLAVVGLCAADIDELLTQQYITLLGGGPAADDAPEQDSAAPRLPASARARMLARTRDLAARRRESAQAGASAE
ncbi:hypothetical protein [Massilia sp. TWR1-2-2]|uniref:hypothetical protein n=1 Tax=Massilia sp. TWR1-2-2 TaxID=2804584 RepID=UPI003CED84D9